MKVLLVNGSPHKDGATAAALTLVEQGVKEQGLDVEWFQLANAPVRGCIDCQGCAKAGRCVFNDDQANELAEAMIAADGIIIGTPVYYAAPNGALCALLDRVFYSRNEFTDDKPFRGKPAASVSVCWRAGTTSSMDRLNKYFTISEMPVISSVYWNNGLLIDEAAGTKEFQERIMTTLGANMAKFLKAVEGKEIV